MLDTKSTARSLLDPGFNGSNCDMYQHGLGGNIVDLSEEILLRSVANRIGPLRAGGAEHCSRERRCGSI
jgi:hypothetical protein